MSDVPNVMAPSTGAGGESLSELLCCYICADRLRDASLCPHCSKMGCYTCIKRWVTGNRANCPHCRAPLTESSLIRVPLFDELRHELEQRPLDSHQERKCVQHREKVSAYCETCRLCICHECIMWESSPHRGHSYIKLEVLLQKQTKICEMQLRKLRDHMKSVLNQVQFVERKMEAVKGSKIKVQREMKEAFDKMIGRLEGQYDSKQQKLRDVRQKLKEQAVKLTRATQEMETRLTSSSVSSLLSDSGELREDILQRLQELQSMQIEPIPSIGELLNEMVPSYSTGVFKIHPYMYMKQKGEELYSKPLPMCGTVWKLKVYPNGHHEATGVCLSVFLELTEGYDKTIKYQYCIEMLYNCSNKQPSRNYKKEYVSSFVDGESWGYRRFYELSKLEDDGFLKDDMVVLRFSVRPLTHHQKCRDLTTHMRRLENRVDGLQKELKAMKENALPLSSSSSNATATPVQNEDAPANYPHSPSRSSRSNHHHHSISEPISPAPHQREGRHSPRPREERSRDTRHNQEHGQEQRRRSEERESEQERRRERHGERVRNQGGHVHVTMSQHTMRGNRSQHSPGGPQFKTGYLSQQRHSDSRLVSLESSQQMSYVPQRRDSGEGLPQRRRLSADPALLQHHLENPISPPTYRHTLAPPPLRPQEHFHFRHDSTSSGPDEAAYGPEELGSGVSLTSSPARHPSGERRPPPFDEGSGDEETGCSQPRNWGDAISHTDIQISISNEGGHPHISTTQPRPQHHLSLYHAQSQEKFVDDEEGGGRLFMPPDTMLGGPFSSQIPYYEQQIDDSGHFVALSTSKCDMPSHTSALSQPVGGSKCRFRSSVPDLSMLTVPATSNLAHSQGLSQSVVEMSRHTHRTGDHSGYRTYHDGSGGPRISVGSRGASQSCHDYLHRMSSDPHLNNEGPLHPGLSRTLLVRLKEVPEHSPATKQRRQRGGKPHQPPKKGYRNMKKRRSPSPQYRTMPQPKEDLESVDTTSSSHQATSSGSNPELTPTNAQPPKHTLSSYTAATEMPVAMGLAGKSSSNTSLSHLDLICTNI